MNGWVRKVLGYTALAGVLITSGWAVFNHVAQAQSTAATTEKLETAVLKLTAIHAEQATEDKNCREGRMKPQFCDRSTLPPGSVVLPSVSAAPVSTP